MTQSNYYGNDKVFNNYLSKTFLTVAGGVGISALFAFLTNMFLPYLFMRSPGLYMLIAFGPIIIELVIAFYFSLNLMKMSKSTAWACYIVYSITTGISFSSIISSYSLGSVTLAFVSSAIMFACMAFIGRTSNFDYTKAYSFLLPALIVGSIVTLLNVFVFHSAWVDMAVVYIGLILFLIITAADAQRLHSMYAAGEYDKELSEKLMIMGAFQLYLDFANLFIRILQIFGRRNNDR